MSDNEPTPTDELVDRVKQHYDAKEQKQQIEDKKPENRTEKGQFPKGVSGNPGGRPKGVVDYVKAQTNDYMELLDLLLKVSRGEPLDGKKPTLREQLDATRELLDRSVGKPTQTIVEKGDETAKEVLVTMQKLLEKDDAATEDKTESAGLPENVSPIDAMKFKGRE